MHNGELKISIQQSVQVYHGSKNIFLAFIRVVTYKAYMHTDTLALAAMMSRGHRAIQEYWAELFKCKHDIVINFV